MLVGVIVIGAAISVGLVMAVWPQGRDRAGEVVRRNEVLHASRRIHDASLAAFQAMLDEVRDSQQSPRER
jgi:hypothetical protein